MDKSDSSATALSVAWNGFIPLAYPKICDITEHIRMPQNVGTAIASRVLKILRVSLYMLITVVEHGQ